MRSPVVHLAVGIVLAGLSTACNSGDDPAIDVPVTSSTSALAGSSTTINGTPSGSSTTGSGTGNATSRPAKPEQAADGLFNAWTANDRRAASRFATARAIEDLFAARSRGEGMESHGCQPVGGQFECSWRYEGGGLIMTVQDAPEGGFIVEAVRFVAD